MNKYTIIIVSAPALKNAEAFTFLIKEIFEFVGNGAAQHSLAGLCAQHDTFETRSSKGVIRIHEYGSQIAILEITATLIIVAD